MKHENENPKEHLERVIILAENSESYDAIVLAAEVRRLRRELDKDKVEYEYAVQNTAISYPNTKTILNNVWLSNKDDAEGLMETWREKNKHSLLNLKVVKRRKAGRIEDV